MYFRVMEKIRNKEIYEKFKAGISADEISQTEGISRARVYQIINAIKARERVSALPLIDDSKTVNELKAKIKELEEKISALEADNHRLLGIIERLVK